MANQKTVKELYNEFIKKFSIKKIEESITLQTLYGYLSVQIKRADGDFYHEPDAYLSEFLKSYLKYEPTVYEKCQSCNWAQTCVYFIKNMQQEIKKCTGFIRNARR